MRGISVTFKTLHNTGGVYLYAANCPCCGAIYSESAVWVQGDEWQVGSSGKCRHWRGIDKRRDVVVYQWRWWERLIGRFLWVLDSGITEWR